MPLTPIDVQQKTFGTALRGYDLDEVDDFLDDVVTTLKDYEQRLRDAQERISTLELQMSDRGDAEGAIARALVAAQRSADSIIEEAKVEAGLLVANAQAEATEVSRAHETERAAAEDEIQRIRSLIADLRMRVHELAVAVGGSLDASDEALDATAYEVHTHPPAVTYADDSHSTWEQPAVLHEIPELDSDDLEDDDLEDDEDWEDEDDSAADFDEDDEDRLEVDDLDEEEVVSPTATDWASTPERDTDEDEERAVRPWEIG